MIKYPTMNKPHLTSGLPVLVLLTSAYLNGFAQAPAYNQNSARINKKQAASGFYFLAALQYGINLAKTGVDSLFFRGNGPGFNMNAGYSFGNIGLGLSGGFVSSQTDKTKINAFVSRTGIPADQMVISTGNQQNMYVLVGPSATFGKKTQAGIHAKAGLFINSSGFVNIQRRGSVTPLYRNEPSSKSVFPGFNAGVNLSYALSDFISVGFSADYLATKSEVVNYDVRRGGAIEGLTLSKNISDIMTGISFRYHIKSPRDAASGQATGKRQHNPVIIRESGSGLATGRRQYEFEDDAANSCGQVVLKRTNADGSVEELNFACPDDAAAYARQTPKSDFGTTLIDEDNAFAQNQKSFIIPRMPEGKGIISGRLTWTTSNATGIITNSTIPGTVRGGSVTMNSQTSRTRATNQSSFGTLVRMSAREHRSGMATGRREYEPVFIEQGGQVCNPCLAEVKMASASNNPLYEGNNNAGANPLYGSNKRMAGDDDCDGIAGINVYLLDINTRAVVSRTRTENGGNFFFANVPNGNYIVKLNGFIGGKKGYDVYLTSNTDLLGSIEQGGESVQLIINTSSGDEEDNTPTQKAGVSTSRSNVRTKSIAIIEADLDSDGEFESLQATATFSDGSTQDITSLLSGKTISNAPGGKKIVLEGEALHTVRHRAEVVKSNKQGGPGTNRLSSITINNTGDKLIATGSFSDGTTRDITADLAVNKSHTGVLQYHIAVGDLDGDGEADAIIKTKTRSNQSNDRLAVSNTDNDEVWSPRSNVKILRAASGDLDGDGAAEIFVGGAIPGGSVLSAAMAGDPIHGVDVKLGFRDKTLQRVSTNENGEFEFSGLQAGNYTITVDQSVFINDESFVSVGDADAINTSETNLQDAKQVFSPAIKTKAQDYNSSRSNKTASVAADGLNNNNDQPEIRPGTSPVKWRAPETMRQKKYEGKKQLTGLLASLDELEQLLNSDESNAKAIINTSRSNIKNQRAAIYALLEALDDLEMKDRSQSFSDIEKKSEALNMQFLALQQSVKTLGQQYTSISNVLKTKHDSVKNSINNIR